MAVRKIQTKRRCICYTRKASKNEENLRTQAHDVESVRITRLDDGEKLRKREYSRELLSIYGEVYDMVNIEWNMDTAKEVWLEEGIEKGIAMGKVEGKVEGKAEGRMETAVELMKEKFPLEKSAKATKLSMEKLQELGRMNGLL